jgi:aspartyl-tRNA(Asn)/glutamyl-tRNA(Gln) amidotransferase subunit B
MEEGSFRCDTNVSVRPVGQKAFGTRAELKNINSFRFIKQAIEYEIDRQIDIVEGGGGVVQETRLFDSHTGLTRSMRSKEEAHDYRYFPDPDLVPLIIAEDWMDQVRAQLPELPEARMERYVNRLGLSPQDAEVLSGEKAMAEYFEACVELQGAPKLCANWIMGEITRALHEDGISIAACPITPERLVGMLGRIDDQTISGKIAKTVFQEMWASGRNADEIIEKKGLKQVTDSGAIEKVVDDIIAANPAQVAEYRGGKAKLMGFFVGQVMKASKGKANPQAVNEILRKKLAE